jgi:hypothetical protein
MFLYLGMSCTELKNIFLILPEPGDSGSIPAFVIFRFQQRT